ncbi:MAG: hypothetical protein ABIN08_20035 [Caldimonas sp.]
MTIHVVVIRRRPPRWLVGVAAVALAAGLFALLDLEAPTSPGLVAKSPGPEDSFGASPMTLYTPARIRAPSESIPEQAPSLPPIAAAERPASPPIAARPELPYRFLGMFSDAEGAALVLHGRGRTVTVRATGPLDDDYAVDAIEDGYLMVRYVPLGTSQVLELAARQRIAAPAGSVDESSPD